jgi:hypothetical protein
MMPEGPFNPAREAEACEANLCAYQEEVGQLLDEISLSMLRGPLKSSLAIVVQSELFMVDEATTYKITNGPVLFLARQLGNGRVPVLHHGSLEG